MGVKIPYSHQASVVLGFNTGADLTATRYRGVQLYASNTVDAGTGTANTSPAFMFGIQTSLPLSGSAQDVNVCVFGPTRAIAGAAFTSGIALTYQTNTGKVIAITTGTAFSMGWSLEAATADGEEVTIFVNQTFLSLR